MMKMDETEALSVLQSILDEESYNALFQKLQDLDQLLFDLHVMRKQFQQTKGASAVAAKFPFAFTVYVDSRYTEFRNAAYDSEFTATYETAHLIASTAATEAAQCKTATTSTSPTCTGNRNDKEEEKEEGRNIQMNDVCATSPFLIQDIDEKERIRKELLPSFPLRIDEESHKIGKDELFRRPVKHLYDCINQKYRFTGEGVVKEARNEEIDAADDIYDSFIREWKKHPVTVFCDERFVEEFVHILEGKDLHKRLATVSVILGLGGGLQRSKLLGAKTERKGCVVCKIKFE